MQTSYVFRCKGRGEPESISNPPLKDTGKYGGPEPGTSPEKHHFCGVRSCPARRRKRRPFPCNKRDVASWKTVFLPSQVPTPTLSRVPMQFTSDSANLYRIETTRKAVILTMLTGEELKGSVFIHLSSYRPFELEDVSELFNADTPFFPLELDNREVILVAKERVAEVAG